MKRLIFLILLLSFIGCSNETAEIDNNNSNKNESETLPSIDGFNYHISFIGNKYTIKVYRENEFIFKISDELINRKQYIDMGYGRKKEIIVSNIRIYNIQQYKNTFYLLINLCENNGTGDFWGIRKFYSTEKNVTRTNTFDSSTFLPTTMCLWFENSLLFSANYAAYPEASISEPRLYDSEFNLISNKYPSGKALDPFHAIDVSGGKGVAGGYNPNNIIYSDIRGAQNRLWKYSYTTISNDFIINDWNAFGDSNNTVHVTINITYKNGEKESLKIKLNKETGLPIP